MKDYGGNLEGKTLGILNGKEGLKSSAEKEKGFIEALQGTGAESCLVRYPNNREYAGCRLCNCAG